MAVWPKFFKQHKEHVLTGYETAVKAGYKGTYEEWLGLKMDSAPTEGSSRPITSGAVYSALAEAALQEDESGGGSGGGLVVNFTLEAGTGDYDGYYIWVTETPAADVIAAIKAGTNVVFYLPGNSEVGVPADQWIPVMAYVEPLGGATTNAPFGNLLSSQSSSISTASIVDGEIIIEAYID